MPLDAQSASADVVLPKQPPSKTESITLDTVSRMTGISITDSSGDVTISASFQQDLVNQSNGDIFLTQGLPSVSRRFTAIAKSPDVQAAVDTLSALMLAAKAEDEQNQQNPK